MQDEATAACVASVDDHWKFDADLFCKIILLPFMVEGRNRRREGKREGGDFNVNVFNSSHICMCILHKQGDFFTGIPPKSSKSSKEKLI